MSDEEPRSEPFRPSLTAAVMPSVDHMFNQGMLNVLLDRAFTGLPPKLPCEFAEVGLFINLVRLIDKSLREYDAARFELMDYLSGRGTEGAGLRTSPYIRAIDHIENLISALARAINCIDRLRDVALVGMAPRSRSRFARTSPACET